MTPIIKGREGSYMTEDEERVKENYIKGESVYIIWLQGDTRS